MITAFGNPVYDYIKTQKIDTKERILSGCSTNAALALTKMGQECTLIGSVGDDYKDRFIADLQKHGIPYEITRSEKTGGFSLIYYDDFGNRTLDLLGRAADISNIKKEWYQNSEAVLIGPILGEVSLEQIAEIRQNFDGLFFCDPQGLLRDADETNRIFHKSSDAIQKAVGNFDILKPNELEGQVFTGIIIFIRHFWWVIHQVINPTRTRMHPTSTHTLNYDFIIHIKLNHMINLDVCLFHGIC